jgi:hypothetical protein
VISSAATGPWGGLTLTRPETTGSKLVFGSAIASSKETGIELDCVVNGFTAGKGTFIAGFFSDTDGWFLRTSGDICYLVFRKGGVETTKNVYLQFTGWSKIYPLKLEWDIKNKRLSVFRGAGAAYISIILMLAMPSVPVQRWVGSPVLRASKTQLYPFQLQNILCEITMTFRIAANVFPTASNLPTLGQSFSDLLVDGSLSLLDKGTFRLCWGWFQALIWETWHRYMRQNKRATP